MSIKRRELHLNAFLMEAGHHEAAWRLPQSNPRADFDLQHWISLAQLAENARFDSLFLADGPALTGTGEFRPPGQLEPLTLLTALSQHTSRIGLIATVSSTYNEPYNLARRLASVDHVSGGRAGWNIVTTATAAAAQNFGLDDNPAHAERYRRAAEFTDVSIRLWDSWEDGAEIRDVTTGRFVDRDKLHYIDFEGKHFSVKGPSITPRPPQGQPLVTALAHESTTGAPFRLLARSTDIGYVTPHDVEEARAIVAAVRTEQEAAGRAEEPLHLFGDLVVFLDNDPAAAVDRRERLDALAGYPYTSDARVFTGTPVQLADLLQELRESGLTGFRLRPAVAGHDLPAITRGLVPELQRRDAFRHSYEADTLRGLLGLARPANRYAAHV